MAQSEFTIGNQWQTDKRSTTRWLLSHLLRNKLIITGTFVGAFGNAALAAAIPIYLGQAFNAVLGNPVNMPALLWASILLLVSQFVRSILQLGRNFSSETLGQRLERDARQEFYASLLGKSMRFHDMHATGDLMARATNDMRELSLMVAPGLNLVIGSANFLLMPLVVAPTIHPSLIATPLVFAIAYAWALRAYILDLNPVTAQVRSTFGTLNARLTEAVEGIETVKGAARENDEIALFEQNARSFRDAFVHRGKIEARFLPLLLLGLAQGAAFMHSLYLYRGGAINVGDLVSYMGLIALFGFPTFVSLFAYSQVSTGYSSAERILELIREETELDQNKGGHAAPIQGAIRFDQVNFGYGMDNDTSAVKAKIGSSTGGQLSLTDISFSIEPGQTLALVGQTGSGKSTVSKLINRIYDVTGGSIFVDGVDVREWDLAALRGGHFHHRAGHLPLQPHHRREHRLWPPRDHPGRDRGRGHRGPGPRLHRRLPGRLRHGDRRAGRHALRRPASTPGPGPGLPHRPGHPDPGRLHQRHRQRHRGQNPTGHRSRQPRPHHHPHHPPPLPNPLGRQNRRPPQRPHRRGGYP